MKKTIRDTISSIITNNKLKHDGISKSDLISLSLYNVFQKEYFNNNYKNSFILKDEENNLWNSTGSMSTLDSRGIKGIISSPDNESDFESQFPWSSKYKIFIKMDDFNKIKKVYQAFKEANDFDDISNRISKIGNKDNETLFLFQSLLDSHIGDDLYYNNILGSFELENNKSDIYKNSIPCKKRGDINSLKSIRNFENINFKDAKYEFLNKINKQVSNFKNLDSLINRYKKQIDIILDKVDEIYPELSNKPVSDNLEFYFVETKSSDKSGFLKEHFKAVDEENSLIKNTSAFKNFYEEDKPFIDFLYQNPFSYSEYNRSLVNHVEGLSYITDDLLYPNDYGKQLFLIAKTPKGETVGTLSLDKSHSFNHLFKITGVCVKNSFRGKGVAKKIYEKLAEISIDNNLIIHNNNYSPLGRIYLPKMKMKVLQENPLFVMIDESLNDSIPDKKVNNALQAYNKHSLMSIKKMEMNKTINIQKTINAYLTGKKLIINQINKPTEISYQELCNYGLKVFNTKIDNKYRPKNKL